MMKKNKEMKLKTVAGCTVPSKIWKLQCKIWAGKGPDNTLSKIELDFTGLEEVVWMAETDTTTFIL